MLHMSLHVDEAMIFALQSRRVVDFVHRLYHGRRIPIVQFFLGGRCSRCWRMFAQRGGVQLDFWPVKNRFLSVNSIEH